MRSSSLVSSLLSVSLSSSGLLDSVRLEMETFLLQVNGDCGPVPWKRCKQCGPAGLSLSCRVDEQLQSRALYADSGCPCRTRPAQLWGMGKRNSSGLPRLGKAGSWEPSSQLDQGSDIESPYRIVLSAKKAIGAANTRHSTASQPARSPSQMPGGKHRKDPPGATRASRSQRPAVRARVNRKFQLSDDLPITGRPLLTVRLIVQKGWSACCTNTVPFCLYCSCGDNCNAVPCLALPCLLIREK